MHGYEMLQPRALVREPCKVDTGMRSSEYPNAVAIPLDATNLGREQGSLEGSKSRALAWLTGFSSLVRRDCHFFRAFCLLIHV
jgi:hypothetical protein